MSDPPDDGTTEEHPSDAEDSTPSTGDPDREPTADDQPSVAAKAGIDEAVLDEPRELASIVRLQWSVRSAIGAVVIAAIAAGIGFGVGNATDLLTGGTGTALRVGGGTFALFALFGVVRALLLYRSWHYVVRADSLFLNRGVFTLVRTVVPYVRVQHIDTTRSPLERVLGLSTLVVYTAGSRGADVTIPGLTPDRASTLQERLERLTTESEEEDAV
jgi:membrane protein YdbS with pleckstrin-like domain